MWKSFWLIIIDSLRLLETIFHFNINSNVYYELLEASCLGILSLRASRPPILLTRTQYSSSVQVWPLNRDLKAMCESLEPSPNNSGDSNHFDYSRISTPSPSLLTREQDHPLLSLCTLECSTCHSIIHSRRRQNSPSPLLSQILLRSPSPSQPRSAPISRKNSAIPGSKH